MCKQRKSLYERCIKRILDVFFSVLCIIIFSPILLILAVMVRVKLGSPIIFSQKRPGYKEHIFTLHKFRTMTDKKDKSGNLLADSERLTDFGKWLRNTSLDELPELFNIFSGDMSFVGPRPQLVKDMVFMDERQRHRHDVRQGLTGLAQINGRNNILWEDKINYDLKYIENITFMGDLRIIVKTVSKVFKKDDVNTEGMDTAQDFGDYLLEKGVITKSEYDEKIKGLSNIN